MGDCLLRTARAKFHRALIECGALRLVDGFASIADRASVPSRIISKAVCDLIRVPDGQEKLSGQTAGKLFEEKTMLFIRATFPVLQNLRPGEWIVKKLGDESSIKKISDFAQYEHLADLTAMMEHNPLLAASIGNDYVVAPDIIVARMPCPDAVINAEQDIVDMSVARRAPLRLVNNSNPILHASISAKWTMRSDRAQNSRTEALNLIRNRKGGLPHIVVATGECLPSRLASLALGTGDIDCIYHFALYELIESVNSYASAGHEDTQSILNILIDGKRLKDISDLPLDLAT